LKVERQTVHVSDDTGRIAMLEVRTQGTDPSPAELTRYIYSNHLQSASLELNESAEIISYEEYHPYGTTSYQAMNAAIKAVAKRYRFTGKERDEESGLYYHGARYYIPWLARWSASDPLESKYAGISPYNYGNCNPVIYFDPNGMEGEKPLEQTKQWQVGVIQMDYAEYKGFSPPQSSFGDIGKSFKVGGYDVLPYYAKGKGPEQGGSPIYYTASQQIGISEHMDEQGNRIIDRNFTRIDFLIMPWGLKNFKDNERLWAIAADASHFAGFGSFENRFIPLDKLQSMDGNYLGALATQWKSTLKNPFFWAELAVGVATLRTPTIEAPSGLMQRKLSEIEAGNLATEAELRVAESYKLSGRKVTLIDADKGHAAGTGTYDMNVQGVGKIDVKRLSGLGSSAVRDVAKGVQQVGEGGTVIVVRPSNSKFTLQQYETSLIKNFKPKISSVKIRIVNENRLPELKK